MQFEQFVYFFFLHLPNQIRMEEDFTLLLFVSNNFVCSHCMRYVTYASKSSLFGFLFSFALFESQSSKLKALILFSLSSWFVETMKYNNPKKYYRNIFSILICVSHFCFIRRFGLFFLVLHRPRDFIFFFFLLLVWVLFDDSTIHLLFIYFQDRFTFEFNAIRRSSFISLCRLRCFCFLNLIYRKHFVVYSIRFYHRKCAKFSIIFWQCFLSLIFEICAKQRHWIKSTQYDKMLNKMTDYQEPKNCINIY